MVKADIDRLHPCHLIEGIGYAFDAAATSHAFDI